MRLAIRCARDSMPPLRLAIVDDLAEHPDSTTAEIRKRVNKPRATVDRQLQALHILEVLDVDEEETEWAGKPALDPLGLPLGRGHRARHSQPEISTRNVSTPPYPPSRGERGPPTY